MLKERNKTQKATYYMTALLGNVQSRQIKSRNKKQTNRIKLLMAKTNGVVENSD